MSAELVVSLNPKKLHPSPVQKRRFTGNDDNNPTITALAANIQRDGQIEPIIVRVVGDRNEIVCGECRTRACRLLGIDVQAIVRVLDDKQAAGQTAAENIQRKALDPIEEAETLEALTERGWTAIEIADSFKLPLSHVIRRMQLRNLSAKWRGIASDPNSFTAMWNAVHFEKIAKFPQDIQDGILKDLTIRYPDTAHGWSTRRFAGYLAHFLHAIDNAPWKKDDETLLPKAGACTGCKKRSDVQPELFDAEDFTPVSNWGGKISVPKSKSARCLDHECWAAKQLAHIDATDARLTHEHKTAPVIITEHAYSIPEKSRYKKRAQEDHLFDECKADAKGAMPALYIDGNRAGQTAWVKPVTGGRSSSTASTNGGKQSGTGKKVETPLKERRANLEMLRSRIVARKIIDAIGEVHRPPKTMPHITKLAFVASFGTSPHAAERCWPPFADACKQNDIELADALYIMSLPVLATELHVRINGAHGTKAINQDYLENAARIIGQNYGLYYAEACAEKPEPKSWGLSKGLSPNAKGLSRKATKEPKGTVPDSAKGLSPNATGLSPKATKKPQGTVPNSPQGTVPNSNSKPRRAKRNGPKHRNR